MEKVEEEGKLIDQCGKVKRNGMEDTHTYHIGEEGRGSGGPIYRVGRASKVAGFVRRHFIESVFPQRDSGPLYINLDSSLRVRSGFATPSPFPKNPLTFIRIAARC